MLRRLLRRAIMKAQLIGIEGHFLNEYVDEIVRLMGDVYPEIVENRELERGLIMAEEDRFGATLRQGQAYLEAVSYTHLDVYKRQEEMYALVVDPADGFDTGTVESWLETNNVLFGRRQG